MNEHRFCCQMQGMREKEIEMKTKMKGGSGTGSQITRYTSNLGILKRRRYQKRSTCVRPKLPSKRPENIF